MGKRSVKARAERVAAKLIEAASKPRDAARRSAAKAETALKETQGPSPNSATNLLIADVAMRGGGRLLRHLVESTVLGARYSPEKARKIVKGRSMTQTLVGTAIARVATRSVPGALLVGGGLLAKTLYDRSRNRAAAKAEGERDLAEQAKHG